MERVVRAIPGMPATAHICTVVERSNCRRLSRLRARKAARARRPLSGAERLAIVLGVLAVFAYASTALAAAVGRVAKRCIRGRRALRFLQLGVVLATAAYGHAVRGG